MFSHASLMSISEKVSNQEQSRIEKLMDDNKDLIKLHSDAMELLKTMAE